MTEEKITMKAIVVTDQAAGRAEIEKLTAIDQIDGSRRVHQIVDTAVSVEPAKCARSKRRALLPVIPPTVAISYPFLLALFHVSVTHRGVAWAALSSFLLLAAIVAPPVAGIYAFWKIGSAVSLSAAAIRARGLALISVAAATLYTTLGVVLAIAHNPVSDLIVWPILWVAASAILRQRRETYTDAQVRMPSLHPRVRFAHGVSAALIVCIFLTMHLISHLSALWSLEAQHLLMDTFRHIYRAGLVEPTLIGLMFFQMGTGTVLVWQYIGREVDLRRTLQIASGAYLLFYIPGHMNSVFIYARAIVGIPTDWNFATGAPTGLLFDAWNIRLLPHYLLAVFFVATHLVLGARIIALAHHVNVKVSDRLAFAGIAGAASLAVAIMVGMTGVHLH
jgi:hypothetical protein